jgi:hypothetical protein
MSLKDGYEKLDFAICVLISSDSSLHDRLESALVEISTLKEGDYPPDLHKEYNLLVDKIHTYRDQYNPSDLQPQLALSIFGLFKSLVSFLGMMPKNKPWGGL